MTYVAVRTPESRFADLPDFAYEPRYIEDLPGYEGLRMAYLNVGPDTRGDVGPDTRGDVGPDGGDGPGSDNATESDTGDAEVVLCLHGEPSWSYLYRKMIPEFTAAGMRVVAPDFYGFGRSDKPIHEADYTWDFHRDSLTAFIDQLGLSNVTLVVQDWGGVLGLTLPVTHPDLVKRLLIMNTALAIGVSPGAGFEAWRDYVANNPEFSVGAMFAAAEPTLSREEAAGYAAPFPDPSYMAGVRRFPQLIATSPDDPGAATAREAAQWWATEWNGPTFMAVGKNDPVLGVPVMERMAQMIRGCPEPMLLDAGHFVQESGDIVARAALASWGLGAGE